MPNQMNHTWRRLSPLSGFVFLVKAGRGLTQALPGLLPAYFFLRNSENGSLMPIALTLLAGFAVLYPALSWYFFKYRLDKSQVQVKSGILNRKKITLEFERIQGINVTQNPIFRFANLFNVQIDTAGSTKEEVSLPGVDKSVVDWVRRRNSETTATNEQPRTDAFLSLSLRQIVFVGLTSNALVFVAVILAPVFSVSDNIVERAAQRVLANYTESLAQTLAGYSTFTVAVLGLLLAIAIVLFLGLLSILGSLLRYGRYQLFAKPDRLLSVAGFLTTHEQSLRRKKIQTLRITQNIRQRLLSCFRITLTQAASQEVGEKGSLVVPYVEQHQCDALLNEIFGLQKSAAVYNSIDSRYVFQTWRNYFALPIGAVVILLSAKLGVWSAFAILLLAPLFALVKLRHARWGYAFDAQHGFVCQGLFGTKQTVFQLYRAQQVSLTQSPFQRRKDLASLSISLASETVTIPFIPYEQARSLQNEILFLTQTDPRAWI